MAIKSITPLKADPSVLAEYYELCDVYEFSFSNKTAVLRYGLYSSAKRKKEGCPPFEYKTIRVNPEDFVWTNGLFSNELIDKGIIQLKILGENAEYVQDAI